MICVIGSIQNIHVMHQYEALICYLGLPSLSCNYTETVALNCVIHLKTEFMARIVQNHLCLMMLNYI